MMMPFQLEKKRQPKTRNDFRYFAIFDTRWRDNDQYGHLNNSIYYELFDSAINELLLENNLLNFMSGDHTFLVASSGCNYFSELAYPQKLEVGLAVVRLGNSSVTYDLGLFKHGSDISAANGFFVHVHVARDSHRPAPITDKGKAVFQDLLVDS
jgi:acyl-CoA thioester hydrolase